jgi:hypothetical protein
VRSGAWSTAAFAGLLALGLLAAWEAVLTGSVPHVNPDAVLWSAGVAAGLAGGFVGMRGGSSALAVAAGAGTAAGVYVLALGVVLVGFSAFGGFGCAYAEVTWAQPGLHQEASTGPAPAAGTREVVEPDGLAFGNGTLDEAWGPQAYALTRVSWTSAEIDSAHGRFDEVRLALEAPGTVTARAPGDANRSAVGEAFAGFAGNATDADDEQVDAWTEAFLASERTASSFRSSDPATGERTSGRLLAYSANLTGSLALEDLYDRLDPPAPDADLEHPAPDADLEHEEDGEPALLAAVGRASTGAGNWSFAFRLATVHVEPTEASLFGDDEDVRELRVDALDRAGASVAVGSTDGYRNRTVELVEDAFADLGWPTPPVTRDRVQPGAVC